MEVITIKSFKKTVCMLLVLFLIIYLTLNSIYDKDTFNTMIHGFKDLNIYYIGIATLLMVICFLLYGYYYTYTFKIFNVDVKLPKGVFYAMVEFYFSGITPSATGGQPVQMYYMTKDKIPIKNSYIALIVNTLYFKIAIIFLGILVLIFKNNIITSFKPVHIGFIYFGLICDFLFCILLLLFLFNRKLIKKCLEWIFKFFRILNVFKKYTEKNIDDILGDYQEDINKLVDNKWKMNNSLILVFILRVINFSIAYVVYKGLGLSGYSYLDLLAIQISVQLAIEMVPIPGGSYVSEKMFFYIFSIVFSTAFASLGMLLTRAFIFYIPIILFGIIIFIYNIVNKVKDFF